MSKIAKIFKSFPGTFWVTNNMELLERWAWYGLFAVLPLYLTNSTDTGALGFSQSQKGDIMGIVTAILYLLPVVTGAVADRFGFKKVLLIAYLTLTSGYFIMGQFSSYGTVYFAFLYVALGAALFKPLASGSIAKLTDEGNRSIGFGIFYMMVNIGGFLGPVVASKLRILDWNYVFIMSTISIALNLVLLLFYKDPSTPTEKPGKYLVFDIFKMIGVLFSSIIIFIINFTIFVSLYFLEAILFRPMSKRLCFKFVNLVNSLPIGESNRKIFDNITIIFKDIRFIIFLVFMVGFWTMFNQIFYTLPNFVDQWIDTSVIYDFFESLGSGFAWFFGNGKGAIAPEMVISFDAGFIVLFQILISSVVMRFKPINAIISGIVVAAIGVSITFATQNAGFVVLGIFIFAIGEMAASPKFTEYVGTIAPKDKVALYMGYSFLPVAIGNLLAGFISGRVYERMSDKVSLLAIEVEKRGIEIPEISKEFTLAKAPPGL